MVAKLFDPGFVITGAASFPAGMLKFPDTFPRHEFLTMMLSVPPTYTPHPQLVASLSSTRQPLPSIQIPAMPEPPLVRAWQRSTVQKLWT